MARLLFLLALAASPATVAGEMANPIRKVVTMLQSMQSKVQAEGEKEEALYKKFMCYCKNSGTTLKDSIAAAENKAPMVQKNIKTAESEKTQLDADVKTHKADREAAKAAVAEATGIREKEAAAFASESSDTTTNINAINKAVKALEAGMGSSFLQTGAAGKLRQLVLGSQTLTDGDRNQVLAFLSGSHGAGYAPQSGEITGILKQIAEDMGGQLADATAAEEAAIADFKALTSAKKKEIEAITKSIQTKTTKVGELAVSIAQMKNDIADTLESLEEDKKFLAELEKGCSTKTAEWEERVQVRSEEVAALADTIRILSDDDALELFKKTLPSASSFLQVEESDAVMRSRALAALKGAGRHPQLSIIMLALHGKKAGFEKVIKMIDTMVATLKTEQADDDSKKEYCAKEFDTSDDTKKALELDLADAKTAISTAEDGIATLTEEIAALEASIKSLDEAVAEATAQRKEESADFTELISSDSATKELLNFAKNRLQKFYNPKLYKAPEKVELSAEDRIHSSMSGTEPPTMAPGGIAGTGITAMDQEGATAVAVDAEGGATVFAQVSLHSQEEDNVAPPPPPETFGAYSKKSEGNTGVLAMIDLLIKDLDKEMQIAKVEEKNAQEEYDAMMTDSAEKRKMDSKSLKSKGAAKADMAVELEAHKASEASATKKLMATEEYIATLHGECDWLIKYFDVRKEARVGEVESLTRAKAVLSGADFSLMQTKRGLRRTRGE